MKNTMGIILVGGKNERLKELSSDRSIAAVPIGGKYRAVDFVLSNMVNSGITNVGVLTQYSFRSLMDHLGSGKEWDLDRRYDGLFVFPPYLAGENSGWYRGTADALYNNLTFMMRSNEEYVLISTGNCVYNMNFNSLIDYHKEKNSDITVVYRDMFDFSEEDLSLLGIVELDDDNRIRDLQEKPLHPKTTMASTGVYLMKRSLLISLLQESAAHGYYDFVKDILIKNLETLKIYGYNFKGYWRCLSSIQLYYRCNMELLDPNIRKELFIGNGKIFTKVKDAPPAKYNEEAEVKNSIVADGCIVEGTVINSVLFRGVTIKKGSIVKDSLIMQDSVVDESAFLEHAILDKNVLVTREKSLKGELNWPVIVGKNTIV